MTSNADKMGLRHAPMALTEQGVAMLSGLLNSERAIKVNIEIMRAFVQLRRLVNSNIELAKKIDNWNPCTMSSVELFLMQFGN